MRPEILDGDETEDKKDGDKDNGEEEKNDDGKEDDEDMFVCFESSSSDSVKNDEEEKSDEEGIRDIKVLGFPHVQSGPFLITDDWGKKNRIIFTMKQELIGFCLDKIYPLTDDQRQYWQNLGGIFSNLKLPADGISIAWLDEKGKIKEEHLAEWNKVKPCKIGTKSARKKD